MAGVVRPVSHRLCAATPSEPAERAGAHEVHARNRPCVIISSASRRKRDQREHQRNGQQQSAFGGELEVVIVRLVEAHLRRRPLIQRASPFHTCPHRCPSTRNRAGPAACRARSPGAPRATPARRRSAHRARPGSTRNEHGRAGEQQPGSDPPRRSQARCRGRPAARNHGASHERDAESDHRRSRQADGQRDEHRHDGGRGQPASLALSATARSRARHGTWARDR